MAALFAGGNHMITIVCFQHADRLAACFLARKAFEHGSHLEKELVSQSGLVGGLSGGGSVVLKVIRSAS